jgi:F0F1-type ATP synthase assembly protein I
LLFAVIVEADDRRGLASPFMDNRSPVEPVSPKQVASALKALDLSTIGLQFAFSVLVGAGIGFGLDRWLRTPPWLMLAFTVLGVAAGVRSIYRAARAAV